MRYSENRGEQGEQIRRREVAGHAIAGIGQNMIYGLWSGYMLIFFTDILGIAGGVAGTIMMLTRLWDGINDPMMGMISERTRSRWGRFRPWLLFMAVPVWIVLILSFSAPDLSPVGKVVWAAVTYVVMSMVFTAVDVPYWSMPSAMTRDVNARTKIFTVSRTATTLASSAVGIVAIPMITYLGGGDMKQGYFYTAAAVGLIGAVCYLSGFAMIREHVELRQVEKFSFKEAVKVLACNKPLLLILLSYIVVNSGAAIKMGFMTFYAQYNLNDIKLVSLMNALLMVGQLGGMVMVPALTKRLGTKRLYIGSCIFSFVVHLAFYFCGYGNMAVSMVLFTLTAVPIGIGLALISSMIANTIEYAEWKTGQRREGLISSTQTFMVKVVIAISGGLLGVLLTVSKYVPNAVQTAETLNQFHFCYTFVIGVFALLGAVPMIFYDLTEERHAEIVKELNERNQNGGER